MAVSPAAASAVFGLLVAAAFSSPAAAGPWVRESGEMRLELAAQYYVATSSSDLVFPIDYGYRTATFALSAEAGLPFGFQICARLPYVLVTQDSGPNRTFYARSFGDSKLELDFRLVDARLFKLAIGVSAEAPLYETVRERSQAGFIEVNGKLEPTVDIPDIGDGSMRLSPKVLAGISIPPISGWVAAELGLAIRSDDYVDALETSLNAGVWLWPEHIAAGVHAEALLNLAEDLDLRFRASRETIHAGAYAILAHPGWVKRGHLILGAGSIIHAKNSVAGFDARVAIAWELSVL